MKLTILTGQKALPLLVLPAGACALAWAGPFQRPAPEPAPTAGLTTAKPAKVAVAHSPLAPVTAASFAPAAAAQPCKVKRFGYWARTTRRATVRDYPGGDKVLHTLEPGQSFHVDPEGGEKNWALGYACPDGGRSCGPDRNIIGFILRSSLGGGRAAAPAVPGAGARLALLPSAGGSTPALRWQFASEGHRRRVAVRELWLRNDLLHAIGVLRENDYFIVERYTDGSRNNGQRVWAIGRGVGRGVNPNNSYGRVLASGLE